MKRIVCVLAALILVLCCFSPITVVLADNGEKANESSTVIAENKHKEGSFSDYLSENSSAQRAEEAIVKELNGAVLKSEPVSFAVTVHKSGLYAIGMSYKTLDSAYSDILVGLKLDGQYPFSEAKELKFPRMWCNAGDSNRIDAAGNEFAPQQIEYKEFFYNEAICDVIESDEKYLVYLTQGAHTVELVPEKGELEVEYFSFAQCEKAENYKKPENSSLHYNKESVVLEGEDATIKSSYFLIGKADTASIDVTPHDPSHSKINYIGGGNWKTVGDSIVLETPELEEGYYQIGFSYRQNFTIGSTVYRKLTVDGKLPFDEAKAIGFSYDDKWQQMFFEDKNAEPYLLYLSKGKHELALTATAGSVAPVRDALIKASEELGRLYIDITMITGETVDVYRDYELFKQIGDMQERLENIQKTLDFAAKLLLETTGETSGANYSIIMNMSQVITQMLENKYEAHKYKDYYYTNYCSVSSVIQSLTEMPLSLDKVVLAPVGASEPSEKPAFFSRIVFGAKRFATTFIKDYSAVSSGDGNGLTVWVSWGRDQAQVLSSLVENSFTPQSGIKVDIKLSNASIVQANLIGDGPDCMLMNSRSTPVNLAMRGVLHDLDQFEDCDEILKRFADNADLPYRYKGKLYALPDTQNFFVMFYRKDILDELGVKIPKTWDEFSLAAKILMRNNMNVALPNNAATSTEQVDSGVGSANIFPTLLMQRDIPLYAEDGKKTNLLSSDVMETLETWTNFYRKQKFPISLDLYTRFRTGTTPIGITSYTFYTTLKAAASEIEDLWGVTTLPGTALEDGSVDYTSAGSGTGCFILKNCDNPEAAWEFLKWWTDEETQLSYSNELEAILGPTGRVAVANLEAFKNLDWDTEALEEFITAREYVEELPEYPGSYYVSRSIYQCFWNVVNANKSPKDMLMKYGKEADDEIARKWKQYSKR